MGNLSSLLVLITGLLALLPCAIALKITDIFTVQSGNQNGGCDNRDTELEQWLSEAIDSIYYAVQALNTYDQDIRVRRAMSTIFGIANNGKLPGNQQSARYRAFDEVRGTC